MNWPFKVHKLEASVKLACETRSGKAVSERHRGGEHREGQGEKIRQTAESAERRENKNESERDGVNERVRQ